MGTRLVLLLAAGLALLLGLFTAGTASASTLPAAGTRVGVSPSTTSHLVGVHQCITAGQHWVRGPSQPQLVVRNCVAAEGIDSGVVDIDQLSSAQMSNYTRYLKSLPKGADYPTITRLEDGSIQFAADVPATNIPGSYATYTKVIGKDGSTMTVYKTTIAPDGSVVSVKVKYP